MTGSPGTKYKIIKVINEVPTTKGTASNRRLKIRRIMVSGQKLKYAGLSSTNLLHWRYNSREMRISIEVGRILAYKGSSILKGWDILDMRAFSRLLLCILPMLLCSV